MFFKKRPSQNVARIYETHESGDRFALVSINGKMKNNILAKLKDTYSIQGDHIMNGGKASPIPILTVLGGGTGALGISAATSGSLFMATANPASLMAIGSGFGSAVMGAGGIVATEDLLKKVYKNRKATFIRFIKHILGFEILESYPDTVSKAFDHFIHSHTNISSRQLDFLNLLKEFILEKETVQKRDLIESPFTILHPDGIRGLFSPKEIDEILEFTQKLAA